MSVQLPALERRDVFPVLTPLMAARGITPGDRITLRPAGEELAALKEAVPDTRAAILASGRVDGVTTCDLVTLPYPTRFGFWRATLSPAPYVWITNRMLVVQFTDHEGVPRTLLWEPSDVERGVYTPYFERLLERTPAAIPQGRLAPRHGTVLGHLRALGIAPEDVDYLAFDHLHTQDVRRLVGTTRPAPDLDGPSNEPIRAWFPNARLLTQAREWANLADLHPLQQSWFQADTYRDVDPDRILLLDGDVLLGSGIALVATPGHTAGNMSLVVNTDRGLFVSSENGIAAESWTPQHSRIPGVRAAVTEWSHEVVLNANTPEFAAWQYNSMVVEALLADPAPAGRFRQILASSELTPHPLSPMLRPTHVVGAIEHGRIRGSDATLSPHDGSVTPRLQSLRQRVAG